MKNVTVFYEATPNPQSMKFIVASDQAMTSQTANFTTAGEALRSPLANKIFGFPWAAGVMIGPNFVTISKQEWVDWDILADPLSELIKEHLQREEPIFYVSTADDLDASKGFSLGRGTDGAASGSDASGDVDPNASPVVQQIQIILRDEIRPAVAMDGGDIVFAKYENGRVHLHMRGACAGCPSSMYTLKEGIETRLKSAIPEIIEVVAV
jgi:Fe-S cluster biogenesis protein NfuA